MTINFFTVLSPILWCKRAVTEAMAMAVRTIRYDQNFREGGIQRAALAWLPQERTRKERNGLSPIRPRIIWTARIASLVKWSKAWIFYIALKWVIKSSKLI